MITLPSKPALARGADCALHTKFRSTVNPTEKHHCSLNCGFLNSAENY
jgi:hypothetical protein